MRWRQLNHLRLAIASGRSFPVSVPLVNSYGKPMLLPYMKSLEVGQYKRFGSTSDESFFVLGIQAPKFASTSFPQ